MRLRKEGVRPARAFAGRRLGVTLATAGLVVLSLTSGVAAASPANAVTYYTIVNQHSLMCLSSAGAKDAAAKEYSCNSSTNQRWYWGSQAGTSGYLQFKNEATGQCLGVAGESTANGAEVVVWSCNGHPDQYWNAETGEFLGLPDALAFFDYHSAKVLQIKCSCATSGSTADQEQFDVAGSPNQAWTYG